MYEVKQASIMSKITHNTQIWWRIHNRH